MQYKNCNFSVILSSYDLYLQAGTLWVNGHNMFDAAAGFGGYKQSGYGRDGGKEVSWL